MYPSWVLPPCIHPLLQTPQKLAAAPPDVPPFPVVYLCRYSPTMFMSLPIPLPPWAYPISCQPSASPNSPWSASETSCVCPLPPSPSLPKLPKSPSHIYQYISDICYRATLVFRSTPVIFLLRQSNYLSISNILTFNSIFWYMLTVFFINVNQFGSVHFSTCSSVVNFSLCVMLTVTGSPSSHYKLPRNNKYHMIIKSRSSWELKNP